MDGPNSASHAVFIDTSLETHLALLVSDIDTISDLKMKVVHEHLLCFPEIGEIKVEAMRVKRKGCFYHLSDTILVKSAFAGVKGNWFLSVVGSRVWKCNQKEHSSDPVSSSPLAHGKSNPRCDAPLKLAICDALSSEQVERNQLVNQNDLNPAPFCPESVKNILNDMEMEVEHDNHCKTSSSERSEHGKPKQCKQIGEGMRVLGGYAESKEVSATNLVNDMHSGEQLDINNRIECGARKKQKVGRKDEDELHDHALNVDDTSVDKLPKSTTEPEVGAVHGSPVNKSEEALNGPNKPSNDEPGRSSRVTTTQGMDAVKIDLLNDKVIILQSDKVSGEASNSGVVIKKRKAEKLSGSGGLSTDKEAAVSNTVDDCCNMPTSDDPLASRNSINGRKKKKTKLSCLQEVPTGLSSVKDAKDGSSKGTLEIEYKVPDEEPEGETFQRNVKTNSEPEAISLGEMGSHHEQEAGEGNEQHAPDNSEADPGNNKNKYDSSKLSGAKDHQMTMTDLPEKHNLSDADKILSSTTEVAGSSKVEASGLSGPHKSGKKSKSKKTAKSDREKQMASGLGHEDELVDASALIENHKDSNTHPGTNETTDKTRQTEVGRELLQKSSHEAELPQERRASERENIVVNTTEVDASSMLDAHGSQEPQKSGKKGKSRKASKSGGKNPAKPDTGHVDGVFSAIASVENHKDSKNDSTSNMPRHQTKDRRKISQKGGSELVLPQKLKESDPDNIDMNATEVVGSSKLDADGVLESQKSGKKAKSKRTTKAGGAKNYSKENKPTDQTEEEKGVLQKSGPDMVLPEHEASIPDNIDADATQLGGSSKLDANEVQEPWKSGKSGRVKKTAKLGGVKQVILGMDHDDGVVNVSAAIEIHKDSKNEFTSETDKEEIFLAQRKVFEGNTAKVSHADTGDKALEMISNDTVSLLHVKDGTSQKDPDNVVKKVKKKHKRNLSSEQMDEQDCDIEDLAPSEDKKKQGEESLHDKTEKAELEEHCLIGPLAEPCLLHEKDTHQISSQVVLPSKAKAVVNSLVGERTEPDNRTIVSNCESDAIDFHDYFIPSQNHREASSPATNGDKVTEAKKSGDIKVKQKSKKRDVPSAVTQDLQNSLKSNDNQASKKKSRIGIPVSLSKHATLEPGTHSDGKLFGVVEQRVRRRSSSNMGKNKSLLGEESKTRVLKAVWTAGLEQPLMNENSEIFSASSSTSKGTVLRKEKKLDHYKVAARKVYGDSKGETLNRANQKKSLLFMSGNIFKDGNDESSADNDADSDASTRTPSDNSLSSDSEVEENMATPVKGTQGVKRKSDNEQKMSGLKDMDLNNVLRCSSRFKKAKLTASQLEETESQTVDVVPDSQAGL